MIREHREATADHSLRSGALLQLELWHREVVEAPVSVAALADTTP